jgi:hypothetical protein
MDLLSWLSNQQTLIEQCWWVYFSAIWYFFTFIVIDVEHLVAHIYTQNGPVELFIKWLQLIVWCLLMKSE